MKKNLNFIFLLVLPLLTTACSGTSSKEPTSPICRTTLVEMTNAADTLSFTFISQPFRTSELSFRVNGPIHQFDVYAGRFYRSGQVIAQIDPRDFRIRHDRAEGTYYQAKAEYERIKALFEMNNLSASNYDRAKADYVAAKAIWETTGNECTDTRLTAPFDGYVGEVFIEKYQDVKATEPILTLVDIDQLRIEAYVTQEVALRAAELSKVTLRFDAYPDREYVAQVEEISKSTTPNNLSYLLTAILPNEDRKLPAGMSGRLSFQLSGGVVSPVLSQRAICHSAAEGDYVWVVSTGGASHTVAKRKVTLGNLLPGEKIAIRSGLKSGEQVVTTGLRFLSEGMNIQISSK